jgi:hypothetical protein
MHGRRESKLASVGEFARGVSVGSGSSCFIRDCVIDGASGAGIEISPRAMRVVVESSTVTGCAAGSRTWSDDLTQQWYRTGECGAVEIEAWRVLHSDGPYNPDLLFVEVVLRECQIVGNLGPAVSVRSPAGRSDAPDREYVDALAARITLEGGSVSGNNQAPGVLSAPIGDCGAVVWNKTKRGKRGFAVSVLVHAGGIVPVANVFAVDTDSDSEDE